MKCDELNTSWVSDEGNISYYRKDMVDEAIAELKDDNAQLKKKLMPCINGDCILTCEVVEKYGKENAEFKQKLDKAIAERDGNQVCIDALKQKLENVQASMYADVVDAGMENRRLKRALWLARAKRASDKALIFYFAMTGSYNLNINGYSDKEKGHTRMRTAKWWMITWLKVERKCRAKAEEYQ